MSQPFQEGGEGALLSDLCIICHTNPPKYRCPRCSTRTCSLPCSRRHKLWSQCSGVRDPAAYLRRNELATPAAFDRDFNFITGIERSVERADRVAENRGVPIDRDAVEGGEEDGGRRKRKRGNHDGPGLGLVKGEAGFLRGAQDGEVNVVRAPRGMTRNKQNTSRWHPKQKCLIWTVEWIAPDGERKVRTCLESCRIAEAYDRFYPLPKEERKKNEHTQDDRRKQESQTKPEQKQEQEQEQGQGQQQEQKPVDEQRPQSFEPPQEKQPEHPQPGLPEPPQEITPYRDIYFYLHRPRTATKQPVIIPLAPSSILTAALRRRTVLEFPTIYVLPDSPESIRTAEGFLLEEEYLRSGGVDEEIAASGTAADMIVGEAKTQGENQLASDAVDLGQVDEKKVLEVLKQDLFEPLPTAAD